MVANKLHSHSGQENALIRHNRSGGSHKLVSMVIDLPFQRKLDSVV